MCGHRILLVRKAQGRFSGYWTMPGGYVEPKELMEKAVVREIWEEARVKAVVDELILIRNRITEDGEENSIYVVFKLSTSDVHPQPDGVEIAEARYFTQEEIQDLSVVLPLSRIAIDKVLKNGTGFRRKNHSAITIENYVIYA